MDNTNGNTDKRIVCNIDVRRYGWRIDAAMECELCLRSLGFGYVKIDRQRGSHGAELYIPEEDRERFEKEVVNRTLVGEYRSFYIGKMSGFGMARWGLYYVSYGRK